jgi:pyrroline-5-carboxylate reductase
LPSQIIASDSNKEKFDFMQDKYKIEVCMSNSDVVRDADIVLAAVKPQHLRSVMDEIRGHIDKDALFISIVAGVKISTIQDSLKLDKVIRTMPNTPACIGKSMTVWTCSAAVNDSDRNLIEFILRAFGDERYVSEELSVDMATALSGSGPAYFFMIMEAMIDAGVHIGFPREIARQLVLKTMEGSVSLALKSGKHPAYLRNDITSPAGTSAAALYQAERGNLRTVISDSIWAAYRRSLELGGEDTRVGPGRFKPTDDVQAVIQAAIINKETS